MSSRIKKVIQYLKHAEETYPFKIWRSKIAIEGILLSLSIVIVGTGSFLKLNVLVVVGFFTALISAIFLSILIFIELKWVFPIDNDGNNQAVIDEEDAKEHDEYTEKAS